MQNVYTACLTLYIAILQFHRQQIARSARVCLEICAGGATFAKPLND